MHEPVETCVRLYLLPDSIEGWIDAWAIVEGQNGGEPIDQIRCRLQYGVERRCLLALASSVSTYLMAQQS